MTFLMLAAAIPATALAQNFNAFNINLQHGSGYKLGPTEKASITGQWVNGWDWGDNFAFMDFAKPPSSPTERFALWAPRLSLGKLRGNEVTAGPVEDVLLAGNIEFGDGFTNYLLGAGLNLDTPGFDFVQVNTYLRNDPEISGATWQMTMVWGAPFMLGSTHWEFTGFFNWAGVEGTPGTSAYSHNNFHAQPQLLLDVGRFAGRPDKVYAGVEWLYWRNKFGIPGLTESVVQAAIKLKF